jgi:glycosyltransferase involved in cell wall biosynthesis
MKIVIFTDTYLPQINGVSKTLNLLTNYLEKSGIDYLIVVPQDEKITTNSPHIFSIKSVPFKFYPDCKIALPNLKRLKKRLIEFNPDLVHIATPFSIGLCGLSLSKKLGIPIVGSFHTNFHSYLQYYKLEFLRDTIWRYLKWFHQSFQKIFVPSKDTLEELKEKNFRHLSIWSHGVDCELFHPIEDVSSIRSKYKITSKYILSFVSRMAPEKDLETLALIIQNTKLRYGDDVTWILAGDGPKKNELMKKTGESNIIYTGFLEKEALTEIYSISNLMVFPSSTETFGNVVLESMACGTPVVCANSGGVRTIVRDYSTGILCEPKNVSSFCQAIDDCLTKPLFLEAMSKKARAYATAQNWDTIFHQLILEYLEVVDQNLEIEHLTPISN